VPPRRKRRGKSSPLIPLLVITAIAAGLVVCALWLWSPSRPDDVPHTVDAVPTEPPATPAVAIATGPPEPTATAVPSAALAGTPAPPKVLAPVTGGSPEAGAPPPEPSTPAPAQPGGAPRLAIIIDDCGQWLTTERAFVALPFPVTLSVLPHVAYGTTIAREATAAGKGVMLHLPMETMSGQYPGPGTITTTMNDAAIQAAVSGDLAELPEAMGVNNHEGSRATADARVMTAVAGVLAKDGRFFIDSRTTKYSVAEEIAHAHGVLVARRNVFLDDVDTVDAVEAALRGAATYARENGSAIAIGHPREATLEAVRRLEPELAAAGIQFTLASNLVH
jgi:polysaccharide deacetylase 2 family uncharacterized protein YibQ